jgi:predicted metal-dependent phosphotriesterase family hydrolase
MHRRDFLKQCSGGLLLSAAGLVPFSEMKSPRWMLVDGPVHSGSLGKTLIHEHIMVDFIGAGETGPHRYKTAEVINRSLPYLLELKELGCETFIDCTPAFIGRDVIVLRQLSEASGLKIMTNTGYYGAVQGKFLPPHAFQESPSQMADRWITEWKEGIEGTGIFPGFIKIGVDKGPLTPVNRKLVEAAAITHKQTGLTISAHTGDGVAAMEELKILQQNGVPPKAFRWVHAQNEKNGQVHRQAASMGCWVEFDGIRAETAEEHLQFILNMKTHGLLGKTLISQDSGWYHVGEENGGDFRSFSYIFKEFIPALEEHGFTRKEIRQLLIDNPSESLRIGVRKA